jgi:hypothetical protein
MKVPGNAGETVEVPRAVLEDLLSKVESVEAKLRSSGREGPEVSP